MRNPGKIAGILFGLPVGAVASLALAANHVGWWSLLALLILPAASIGLGALVDEWA